VRLFDGNFVESQDTTSRIELVELQAKAFPDLLDYLYSVGDKMSFTTDTATALYSIAKYFGVARLQNEVKKFCLEDMQSVDRCGTYYEHAKILQEDGILEPAATFCRDNIKSITCKSRLLRVADPQFWLDLMKEHAERGTNSSLESRLSAHIAQFCFYHARVLSPEIFMQLTDKKYLLDNYIHPQPAIALLDAERRIVSNRQDDELSSLQIRCVKAIAGWKDKLDVKQPLLRNILTSLPPSILYEIIAARG
jgi:BTB/POZ domain